MTIYICGGSNSILKDGWTRVFSTNPPDVPVVNLSIGGTHSITGLYRAMFTADLQPGDVLLWEYCLNDINQLRRSPQPARGLLACLEILLTHCAQRQVRVGAMLLTNRAEAASGADKRYRVRLRRLLEEWQVPYADPNAEHCEATGAPTFDEELYQDNQHYAMDTPFMDDLRSRGLTLLSEAKVPQMAARRFAGVGRGMAHLDQWSGAEPELAGTSLVRLRAWAPEPELRITVPCDATLVAAALFISEEGGGFVLTNGDRAIAISGRFRHEGKERKTGKSRFATVFLQEENAALMEVKAGDELVLRWLPGEDVDALQGYGIPITIKARKAVGRGARIVGLLVEVDGGLGAA